MLPSEDEGIRPRTEMWDYPDSWRLSQTPPGLWRQSRTSVFSCVLSLRLVNGLT